MNTTTKQINTTHRTITISLVSEDINEVKNHIIAELSKGLKVPGFRPGKAPKETAEKHLDQKTLQSEVLSEAVNTFFFKALSQEGIQPVTEPKISITKFVPFTELEFVAEVAVLGQIKLGDYKKIRVKRKEVSITDAQVQEVIESLLTRSATKTIVARPAKVGDEVLIDFLGKDSDGKEIPGAKGSNYPLVLGSKSFIPGFEEALVGVKAADEKTFEVTFPKDYHAKSLQNKKVSFSVTVHDIKEVVPSELSDAFAASVGPFKDVEELKADITTQLQFEKDREQTVTLENECVEKMLETSKVEIPEELVKEQVERMLADEKSQAVYRGQTFDELLSTLGQTEEEFITSLKPEAEKRIRIGVLLSEISKAEGIDASPEEVATRQQLLKSQYQDPGFRSELDKPEVLRDLRVRIVTEKTLTKMLEYAIIKK